MAACTYVTTILRCRGHEHSPGVEMSRFEVGRGVRHRLVRRSQGRRSQQGWLQLWGRHSPLCRRRCIGAFDVAYVSGELCDE
jgi:hypothetical protein